MNIRRDSSMDPALIRESTSFETPRAVALARAMRSSSLVEKYK